MKIPGMLYPENSEFAKRSKYVCWRAAVESSTTVEQLALQVWYPYCIPFLISTFALMLIYFANLENIRIQILRGYVVSVGLDCTTSGISPELVRKYCHCPCSQVLLLWLRKE